MNGEPKIEFHTELDALGGLANELTRIATQANDALKQLAPGLAAPDHGPVVESDTSALSTALRYQQPEKPAQFVYIGEVKIGPDVDEMLKSFKPTISFEVFELGNNRNIASALVPMTKDAVAQGDAAKAQAFADSCRQHLTRIIARASLLALTIQNLTRSHAQQFLLKLVKGETAEYLEWRSAFEAAHTKLRAALESAYPNSTNDVLGVPAGFLVSVSFALRPNQQTINGVYFPPDHEAFVLKKLAAMQAAAISQPR
ncbi:MAG: hypothetical protein WDO17_01530 [Alphaproteobacteria bacterium]